MKKLMVLLLTTSVHILAMADDPTLSPYSRLNVVVHLTGIETEQEYRSNETGTVANRVKWILETNQCGKKILAFINEQNVNGQKLAQRLAQAHLGSLSSTRDSSKDFITNSSVNVWLEIESKATTKLKGASLTFRSADSSYPQLGPLLSEGYMCSQRSPGMGYEQVELISNIDSQSCDIGSAVVALIRNVKSFASQEAELRPKRKNLLQETIQFLDLMPVD